MTGIQVPTCLETLYLPAALTVLSSSLIADVASDNENRIGTKWPNRAQPNEIDHWSKVPAKQNIKGT
jgi:hypothetical protein